jgi:predicted P-loop ATPase
METGKDVVAGLVSAMVDDWRRLMVLTERGKLADCWQNVYTVLDHHPAWKGVLGMDTFAQRVVKRRQPPLERSGEGPWTTEDDAELGIWLKNQDGSDRLVIKGKQTIIDGVNACAWRHKFHPVREFMERCRPGPRPLLDTWTSEFLGVLPTPYSQAVGRYFLINMVARIFDPGCIMRSVPVLEGAQERGKSTALYGLAQPWFSDSHFELTSKDSFEVIQGVLLYEISEMEQFNKAETTRVKQFISSREDNYRPAYERRAVRIPRQVCFAGSTNDRQYLKDFSGNTRFWPLRCEEDGEILPFELAAVREQLYAEALEAWRNKARRHPTREESRLHFEPEQAARRPEHPWMPMIARWLDEPLARGVRRDEVTVTTVLGDCLAVDAARMTQTMQRDVGLILTALGWEQSRPRCGGPYRPRLYTRPQDEAGASGAAIPPGPAPGPPGGPPQEATKMPENSAREPGSDDETIPF